jgi:predicted nucleotidyltransferase
MNLDTEIRASLARRILAALESAVPGSTAQLRGSLAEGRADQYSDIDVCWEVPDELFQASVKRLPKILSEVHPVESLRSNPVFQNSDRRRLIFVQFEGLPLFWRVDVDIFAQSIHGDREYDVHNGFAAGDDWSLTHSALMNAIGAVKALLRNEEEEAKQLLVRAFERVGLAVPEATSQELVLKLTESVAEMDPTKAELARKIEELHREVFD